MKTTIKIRLLLSISVVLFIQCEKEEPYGIIHDEDLLELLIEKGIDTDGDGVISYQEAEPVTRLSIKGKKISSLKGIEAFKNLEWLHICQTSITNIHLPGLYRLESLWCHDNNLLTRIDLSKCVSLQVLSCANSSLPAVDLSRITKLRELICPDNLITELDLSYSKSQNRLDCGNNFLTSLDVSPCDSLNTEGSPNVYFTTVCSE